MRAELLFLRLAAVRFCVGAKFSFLAAGMFVGCRSFPGKRAVNIVTITRYGVSGNAERGVWALHESALRKAVYSGRLVNGVDACKYGRQRVISVEAMEREYGRPKQLPA